MLQCYNDFPRKKKWMDFAYISWIVWKLTNILSPRHICPSSHFFVEWKKNWPCFRFNKGRHGLVKQIWWVFIKIWLHQMISKTKESSKLNIQSTEKAKKNKINIIFIKWFIKIYKHESSSFHSDQQSLKKTD